MVAVDRCLTYFPTSLHTNFYGDDFEQLKDFRASLEAGMKPSSDQPRGLGSWTNAHYMVFLGPDILPRGSELIFKPELVLEDVCQ